MAKIKVCHVVCGLISGGVESMILNYCSRLNSKKFEFHILHQHEAVQKNVIEFQNINCKIQRIPSKVKHPIKNYICTYNYLKNNKIDVVHCHMTLMNFIPLIAAKRLGIKARICHSHNSDVRKKNIFVNFGEKILKKLSIRNANVLIACGKDAGMYMYGNKEFIILNNALDLSNYKFDSKKRKKIREQFKITDEEILVGHIGRFTEQKNHKFIIEIITEVVKQNSNIKFMFLGDGELKSEIEQLVNDYNIQENVIFTGIVPNANDYYSAFDLFILPSIWEGLPVVAIEAQAAGLPCIFSSNIDTKSIIDQEKSCMLSLKLEEWVSKILNISSLQLNRKIDNIKFQEQGLDINYEVMKLENIYCKKNDNEEEL